MKEFAYPINAAHFILTIIAFLTKYSSYSIWSFSYLFYTLMFYLSLVGFFYWLLNDEKKGFLFGGIFFLMRDFVSFSIVPYPNTQHIYSSFFVIISLYNYFFSEKKIISFVFLILSFLGYQFIHISESALLSIFLISIFSTFIFLKIFFEKKDFKSFFSFRFLIKNIFFLFPIFFPIFFHSIYVIKNFDYSQLIKINEKTDPFIVNLYSIYQNFNLKNTINFYFKDLTINDNLNEFFFLKGFFVNFILLFILIGFSWKEKNKKLLYFSLFVFFTNIFVFNLGFITQKILPLWLMMRIDYFIYFVIFISIFYLINFLFEKIINNKFKSEFLFLFFMFFLLISIIPRIQKVREYSRMINKYSVECELFWNKLNDKVKFSGAVYSFKACSNQQFYLNVLTLNSRYNSEEKQKITKQLDKNLSLKKPKAVKNFKNFVNYLVIGDCNKNKFKKYNKIIKSKKIYLFPDNNPQFCVFKI